MHSNGHFWESHKLVRECLERAMFDAHREDVDEDDPMVAENRHIARVFTSMCVERLFELNVERARRIRGGEEDRVSLRGKRLMMIVWCRKGANHHASIA
jgi:hypothetical protein